MRKTVILTLGLFISAVLTFSGCVGTENSVLDGNEIISFSHGIVSDGKFESKLLKIGIDPGDEWNFATDEELAKANGIEEVNDDSLEAALKNKNFVCDMIAEKKNEGSFTESISVTYPNIRAEGASGMSEKEYAEASFKSIDNKNAVLENISFAGKEHSSIKLSESKEGIDLFQRMIFVERGRYIGIVTVTCLSEKNLDQIVSGFYSL